MTREQLKSIFQNPFNLDSWQHVLMEVFGVTNIRHTPKEIVSNESKKITGYELGTLKTADNYEIGVYAFEIGGGTNIELNRVGLRSLVNGYTKYGVDAAITVYYDKTQWRLSFICDLKQEKTAPKRFTYTFGSPEDSYRTASERLAALAGNATFATIRDAFSVEALSKQFYGELSNWYFWALTKVKFPDDLPELKDTEIRNATMTIRLITRLMFVWFLKKKGIIPECLFNKASVDEWLNYSDTTGSTYYKAVLQNLFFATLNLDPKECQRGFRERQKINGQYTKKGVVAYRYKRFFKKGRSEEFVNACHEIPFLNGGLFENLDKNYEETNESKCIRVDCFSDLAINESRLAVPDDLFFNEELTADLSKYFDDTGDKKRNSAVKVKGLFQILKAYNFTVEENTPYEKDVALDPELLGQIFENLLACYNPETKTTARKQTGSFYTPREIVQYMVNESLIAYLKTKVGADLEDELYKLTRFSDEELNLSKTQKRNIVTALFESDILDPACGSGAFPMGILQQMVHILNRVDADNRFLREMAIQKAMKDCCSSLSEDSEESMEDKLSIIGRLFDETRNRPDYVRKLHLIENCIFGIDIQPVAVQISKLRFFISLVVEQESDIKILPLPNLETKFVAANTLIGIDKPKGMLNLKDAKVEELEDKLRGIRHEHFFARSTAQKKKCRDKDDAVREDLKNHLVSVATGVDEEKICQISAELLRLQTDLESVQQPKWETISKPAQTMLFDDSPEECELELRVDTNKIKRAELDQLIRNKERIIQRETAKAKNNAFIREAEKLAQWKPYDQNATSPFFDSQWMFNIDFGFDIIIGNPPYVQLQENGGELANLYAPFKFETFARSGDIYCLFYEKANQLLKENGHLCYITSNKWMRAGYGEGLRKFLAMNTNPITLIDFAGQKIFDSATVDTNILLSQKTKLNAGKTQSCIASDLCRQDLNAFVHQQSTPSSFNSSDSWIILNPIEKSIKAKIDAVGIPLKNWDIQINYGIKTGFNGSLDEGGCFIITDWKRKEILANCGSPEEHRKTDELIRPILRGRDIKRYDYEYANMYVIATFPVLHIDIEKYPAIKKHLLSFGMKRLEQTGCIHKINGEVVKSRKKTANKWFETSDTIAYWEDFYSRKIMWAETMRIKKNSLERFPRFSYTENTLYTDKTCFFTTGSDLKYILAVLNSSIGRYQISQTVSMLDDGGYLMQKIYIEQIKICNIPIKEKQKAVMLVDKLLDANLEKSAVEITEQVLDNFIFDIFCLTLAERNYIMDLISRPLSRNN